jgi:hypothetical protein
MTNHPLDFDSHSNLANPVGGKKTHTERERERENMQEGRTSNIIGE